MDPSLFSSHISQDVTMVGENMFSTVSWFGHFRETCIADNVLYVSLFAHLLETWHANNRFPPVLNSYSTVVYLLGGC
jgi:uncharacterized protein (DUF486 family)